MASTTSRGLAPSNHTSADMATKVPANDHRVLTQAAVSLLSPAATVSTVTSQESDRPPGSAAGLVGVGDRTTLELSLVKDDGAILKSKEDACDVLNRCACGRELEGRVPTATSPRRSVT